MTRVASFPRRTGVLLGILCLVGIAYVVTWHIRSTHRFTPTVGLHGDDEDVAASLTEMESHTPASRVEDLLVRYSDDSSPILRHAAVEELVHYRNEEAIDEEERAFSDSSADVRYSALYNLNEIDRQRGLRLLAAGLRDQDTLIRESDVADVEEFRDPRLVPNLIARLQDPDPFVVHLAIGALHKITGQPYMFKMTAPDARKQTVIRQWETWWRTAQSHWAIDEALVNTPAILPTRVDPAPDFDLSDIDGRPLSLADQRGRVTLLNFWGTWCPPCQEEIPDLVRIDRTYRNSGVDVVGIALSEKSVDSLRAWCGANSVDYRQAMPSDAMLDAYGHISQVPVSVLIDARGRIRYRWEGPRDYATFSAAVDRVLKESR